ncbi:MAG TPA: malonyl-CoA decarboxylase N-terminal domain-containing protein, partial [Burkholderiales bacterium]|nr:malonyl-CoA decarboxylase N-terminal domain-containing protein [Burkholderiales bacterium]
MRPTRPSAVQIAAWTDDHGARAALGRRTRSNLISTWWSYLMDTPSFLKRLVGSVIPTEGRRAHRRARQVIELFQSLLSQRGEVSGALIARDALSAYNALPKNARPAFYDSLAAEFTPNRTELDLAYRAYDAQPTQANLVRLQHCVEAPRQELFRRLNAANGGTASLVAMRREVLSGL